MFDDLLTTLSRLDRDVSDAERIDQLAALERVKAVCAAAHARITVDFAESQEQVAAAWRDQARECAEDTDFPGWMAAREQARRAALDAAVDPRATTVAPAAGSRARRRRAGRAGSTRVAVTRLAACRHGPGAGADLPRTSAALEAGGLNEWRAEIVVREIAVLDGKQRRMVDADLFEGRGLDEVAALGDRERARRVRAIAYRLDAESVLARCRGAEAQRRVTIRQAPDVMSYVTAYLPVAQGVAVYAALTAAAGSSRAASDDRPTGHLMADLLVERVTGQASAAEVPVEVQVVMTDRALIASDDTPAQVPGYGTAPGAWARRLVADDAAQVSVRRLFTHPADGTLVAMDSTQRNFDGGLRRFLIARDGTCRTPWCDAPIRHLDHVVDHASGGPTTADNGQGLCVRCNHTKQLPGWRARPEPARPPGEWRTHTVVTLTPTSHRYTSSAPRVLPGGPAGESSHPERRLETLLAA
jgi:hypothetical protein